MKILTLFLALFLTFLPESTPNVFFSQGGQQEVCWEEADELEEGQGTVGTRMELSHLAATPLGMTVCCETELVEIDRRKLVFKIEAYDGVDKVAEGRHERFIVDNAKFLGKANGKLQK